MYRRITMTAIMLTLLGGLALLGGRARQTYATPAGTLGTRFPLYVAASNTIITVDSTGVQRPVTAGDLLDRPQGLAFDSSGTFYVASLDNNCIVTVDSAGHQSVFTAGDLLNDPSDLAFDSSGTFYVASQFNDRVVTVDSTGTQHLVTAGGISMPPLPWRSRLAMPSAASSPRWSLPPR